MPTHIWGDTTFDWGSLYKAEEEIRTYVRKWSLCNLIAKEKYGTLRYEYIFPPFSSVRRGPTIYLPFFKRKTKYGNLPIILWTWGSSHSYLFRKFESWGWSCTRRAVYKACLKYPHIQAELLDDLYCSFDEELLKKEFAKWGITYDNPWKSI